jgi:uncharacterized protein (DUF1697 family)
MTALRALFERLGAHDVFTYIQSGNVIFEPPKGARTDFAATVERALVDEFGLNAAVVVRSASELCRTLAAIPYPATASPSVHVGFFKSRPSAAEVREVSSFDAGKERVLIAGRDCFLYLPDGVGRAKLPVRLNRLSTPVTIRNLRTVTALADLASLGAAGAAGAAPSG